MAVRTACALCFAIIGLSSGTEGQGLTPPLNRWIAGGGSLQIVKRGNYFRLEVPKNADWGNCYVEGKADIDTFPYLALWVVEASGNVRWQLTVNDPEAHSVQKPSTGVGLHVYDLRTTPGWKGTKEFRLYFTVEGRGRYVDVAWIDLFRTPSFQPDPGSDTQVLLQWERMNDCLATVKDDGLAVSLEQRPGDWWGGAERKAIVDVDRLPFIEVDVRRLTPQTRWRIEIGNQATGPESRNAGVLVFNYRDPNNWHGKREVDIRLIVLGSAAEAQFASVRLTPAPSASGSLVDRASKLLPGQTRGKVQLATGDYQTRYDPGVGCFRIERKGNDASLVTRLIEMPGVDLAPPGGYVVRQSKAEGDRISFLRELGDVEYKAQVETFTSTPALLHWRVTATPHKPTTLQSCGHELCYLPAPSNRSASLQPITSQNLSASAVACVIAPGVGTILYFQNLTALNPLFDLCHFSPRWLVSSGSQTFGFTNPLDTNVKLPVGVSFTLSDAWLYLSPTESEDAQQRAEVFLQGLSAIYDHLPDKPDTEYFDWQQLARQSLKDLHRPQCWGVFSGKEYLQPYVDTNGAVAQLVPLQDVLAPLKRFHQNTGEGADIVQKLSSVLPDFWYPKTRTLRTFAQPGEHACFDTTFHANLCRVALAGDEKAKDLCLRTADALMGLAHETHYTFQRQGVAAYENELAGGYILFMMYCHEMAAEPRFLVEAEKAAEQVKHWGFKATREIWWTAMCCEGLARLYATTKDKRYIHLSFIPLASLMRNAWIWECDYGPARRYVTFFGLNADASGIDYIAAMEQHQSWYALRQYYLLTRDALPAFAKCLVSEFIRYGPMTIWYAYPPHLPPESLHQGLAFWKTTNIYDAYIPVENLNDGWRKIGFVGQEIYGAGACFNVANESYTRIPSAGIILFSEYPVLKTAWDNTQGILTAQIGGVSHHETKVEIRFDPKLSGWGQTEQFRA